MQTVVRKYYTNEVESHFIKKQP